MSSQSLGVACLGVSHPHASGRTRKMQRTDGVRVLGVADEDPVVEPFSRHLGLDIRTVDEILGDHDVDAVLIHSKSSDMAPLAVRAMEAGKAVLVEKPGGATVADLQHLRDVAEATGAVCQVGYAYRFSRVVEATDRALVDGSLGDVLQVRAHAGCSLDEAATSHLNQPDDMGGALWVIGCHMLDIVLSHFGMPDAVNARVDKFAGESRASFREDAANLILRYPDRSVSFDFFSWDSMPWVQSWQLELHGTNGSLYARPLPSELDVFLSEPASAWPAGWTKWSETSFPVPWAAEKTEYSPELAEIGNVEFFEREGNSFLDAVRGTSPVVVSIQDALNVARLIEAAYRSSELEGRSVEV